MKFIKKAAALLFCLTLVFSVMAISASADGEVTFAVKLALVDTNMHDYDNDEKNEVSGTATLTYNIQLASNTASQQVTGVSFKVNLPSDVSGATYVVAASSDQASVIASTATGVTDTYSIVMDTESYITTNATVDTFDTIGTVAVTLTNATADKDFQPSLSDISLAKNGVEAPFTPSYTAAATVKINPKYTITLTYKEAGADGVIQNAASVPSGSSASIDYYYDSGAAAALPTFADITAYTNEAKWKLTGESAPTDSHGWTDAEEIDVNTTIAANRIGNVTLEAVYTPIDYTVTYTLDTDGAHTGSVQTYNITQVADGSDYFALGTAPTRAGFSFVGWTSAGVAKSPETAYKTDKLDITESFTTVPSFAGAYGDVTFTAVWKAAGEFKFIDYAYAGAGKGLVLFAVASNDVVGEYKYNGNTMYKVSANKYSGEFTNFPSGGSIFAYIVADGTESKVTVDKGDARNADITYDGNVYNDEAINAGDFGNVLNMLNAGNEDDFNLSMISRLKADNSADAAETESANHYGSITDAKEIAKKVGSTVTAVSTT